MPSNITMAPPGQFAMADAMRGGPQAGPLSLSLMPNAAPAPAPQGAPMQMPMPAPGGGGYAQNRYAAATPAPALPAAAAPAAPAVRPYKDDLAAIYGIGGAINPTLDKTSEADLDALWKSDPTSYQKRVAAALRSGGYSEEMLPAFRDMYEEQRLRPRYGRGRGSGGDDGGDGGGDDGGGGDF